MTSPVWSKENPECGPLVAYRYEKAGFRIVPVPKGGKSPRLGGFGKDNPTYSVDAVDFHDDDRVAILCGACPRGGAIDLIGAHLELTCLDLDGRFDQAELIGALGELPETLTSKGGKHRYYWVPDVPLRERVKQWVKLATCEGGALDFKWRGGYAIENGDWDQPFDPSRIAMLPIEALERVVARGEKSKADEAPRRSELIAALAKTWPQESGRYESSLALGGILARSDLGEDEIAELAQDIFDAAGVDDRTEQVLASVGEVRAGGNAYGWPKLKEHMLARAGVSKQLVGRACNNLARYLGIDKESRQKENAGTPSPEDFIVDPDVQISKNTRIAQIEAILSGREQVFEHAGRLAHITMKSKLPGEPESCRLTALNIHTLERTLSLGPERFWRIMRSEKGGEFAKETDPPREDCLALLAQPAWPAMRQLRGLSFCPFLRPDGSICLEPGYDLTTGYYLDTGAPKIDAVGLESPTLADAQSALGELIEPFAEFPWLETNHALVPLSLILSGLARSCVDDVPCHALDASTPGSGKGLALSLASSIVYGNAHGGVANWPEANDEELQKLIVSLGLEGRPYVLFDNVRPGAEFGGPSLEGFLTASGKVTGRILGKSEAPSIDWRTIIAVTGNQLQTTGDMGRRTLVARLVPQVERPELLTFRIKDVRRFVAERRARYIRAALLILRAHFLAGRPGKQDGGDGFAKDGCGSFILWSEIVADALWWVSGADVRPLRRSAQETAEGSSLETAWSCLAKLMGDAPQYARDVIRLVYDSPSPEALNARDALGELLPLAHAQGGKPNPKQIGKLFLKYQDKIIAGRKIVRIFDQSNKVVLWQMK